MAELISIITPAFKAQGFIYRAVSSVIAQTYPDWEMLIISDDGFDYEAFLKSKGIFDPRLRFFSSPSIQSGPNRARNVGLSESMGCWIAPLDADDAFYPDRLGLLLEAAQDTGLALDNGYLVEENEEHSHVLFFEDKTEGVFSFEDFKGARMPLLFLFHRGLIAQAWDEDIQCSADTLFNLRALECVEYARFIARPLHEYRVHSKSICHSEGAAARFDQAYLNIISRLQNDGLGFHSHEFRALVKQYFEEKLNLNRLYGDAIGRGFSGNYQQFVVDAERCAGIMG